MKTRSSRAGLLVAGALCLCLFSAHRPLPATSVNTHLKMEEYAEVFNYVTEYICKPIRSQLKANYSNNPKDYFSRCPSGYQSRIVTARDSVTTNRYVSGKILFYRGCAPREVCVFKVCVDSGFAVVRSKGGEYMSVEKWIALRNQEGKTQVQS